MSSSILFHTVLTAGTFCIIYLLEIALYNVSGLNHFSRDREDAVRKGHVVIAHRVGRRGPVHTYQFILDGKTYRKKMLCLNSEPPLVRLYYKDSPDKTFSEKAGTAAAVVFILTAVLLTVVVTTLVA